MNDRASGPTWVIPRVKRIGVVHAQGDHLRLVVAEGGPTRIVAAETFPRTALADLRAALTKHHVRRIIHLVPAARTIARAVQIPRGQPADLLAALELMTEAQLAAVPQAHRRGWGLLPVPAASGHASAILIGWMPGPAAPVLDGPHAEDQESWTSELVALALLLRKEGASAAACIDRAAGSIGIASCDPTLKIRSIREDPESSARLDQAIEEIRATIGADAITATDGDATLIMSKSARDRFAARAPEASQPQWVARYGLAAAIALGVVDDDIAPQIRAAVSMRATEPAREMAPPERIVRWLASPRHAVAVIAIGCAAMLLVPWGLAWARHAVLSARLESTREGGSNTSELQARGDFMDELMRRRWPVTKLMANIAGSMPIGVQAESISITPGDRVQVRGTADTSDKLTEFAQKLSATGVFQARIDSRERVGDGIAFDVLVQVVRPTVTAKGLEDYAEKSLGVRLYGEGYKELEAVEQAKQRDAESKRTTRGNARNAGFDPASSRQAEEDPIPEPLTAEKIASLDRGEAGKEMSLRRKVASRAGIDPEVKRRLNAEYESLKARLGELKAQGK